MSSRHIVSIDTDLSIAEVAAQAAADGAVELPRLRDRAPEVGYDLIVDRRGGFGLGPSPFGDDDPVLGGYRYVISSTGAIGLSPVACTRSSQPAPTGR